MDWSGSWLKSPTRIMPSRNCQKQKETEQER